MSLFFGEDVLFGKKGSRKQKHSNKEEKCPVAVDLEMKSDCIVISSSSNDEIEIFGMSLFFGEDVLFGKKGSRIIDSSDSSFTVKGSGENPADSP
jgi:hypothetical protein